MCCSIPPSQNDLHIEDSVENVLVVVVVVMVVVVGGDCFGESYG